MMAEFECSYDAASSTTLSPFGSQSCECTLAENCSSGYDFSFDLTSESQSFCCSCDDDESDYIVGWELISLCATIAINLILGVVLWITCNLKTIEQNHGDVSEPMGDAVCISYFFFCAINNKE